VIDYTDVKQGAGLLQMFGDSLVRLGRTAIARGMAVKEYQTRGPQPQCLLNDLARIDGGAIDRSAEKLDVFNEPVP